MWSLNIVVGTDDDAFMNGWVALFPYSHAETNTMSCHASVDTQTDP